jgi:hypothetical protein
MDYFLISLICVDSRLSKLRNGNHCRQGGIDPDLLGGGGFAAYFSGEAVHVSGILAVGKRFVVRAEEKLTAFLELQRVTRESFRFPNAE